MSLMLSEAVRVPVAVGVKVTVIVQLLDGATAAPLQVSLSPSPEPTPAKSPALVPVMETVLTLSVLVPLLVRVTVRAELVVLRVWLLKSRLVGERLTVAAVPLPLKGTVCGLPAALSLMLSKAFRLPVAVGVKVTLMVQLPPAATEVPQLLLCAKSPALLPVSEMPLIVNAALPVLLSVTACPALVVFSG